MRCFSAGKLHMASKYLLTSCMKLVFNTYVSMPYDTFQRSWKTDVICIARFWRLMWILKTQNIDESWSPRTRCGLKIFAVGRVYQWWKTQAGWGRENFQVSRLHPFPIFSCPFAAIVHGWVNICWPCKANRPRVVLCHISRVSQGAQLVALSDIQLKGAPVEGCERLWATPHWWKQCDSDIHGGCKNNCKSISWPLMPAVYKVDPESIW